MDDVAKRREQDRLYKKTHPDVVREAKRRFRAKHKERLAEMQRVYYWQNREKALEYARRYHQENKVSIRERRREWRRRNPEAYAAQLALDKERNERWRRETPELYKARYKAANRQISELSRQKREAQAAALEAARPHNQEAATAALIGVRTKGDLSGNSLFSRINELVPRGIQPTIRDDIISEIVVAALSGDFDVNEIEKHVPRYIARQISQFQSKYGPVSLDAARFDDGDRTLHDTVSKGLWDD